MEALRQHGAFAVNILHSGQQASSTKFASSTADRFADTDYERSDRGVPIIGDAMANFECSIEEVHEGGDHLIVVGRVTRVHFDPTPEPLLFLQGKYRPTTFGRRTQKIVAIGRSRGELTLKIHA